LRVAIRPVGLGRRGHQLRRAPRAAIARLCRYMVATGFLARLGGAANAHRASAQPGRVPLGNLTLSRIDELIPSSDDGLARSPVTASQADPLSKRSRWCGSHFLKRCVVGRGSGAVDAWPEAAARALGVLIPPFRRHCLTPGWNGPRRSRAIAAQCRIAQGTPIGLPCSLPDGQGSTA
jgi:hypothetical protein